MTTWLCNVLQEQDDRSVREAFDCLFDYYRYKGYLNIVGQQRSESMKVLVFDQEDEEYVGHVQFSSTSIRTDPGEFTVYATLTCQRCTYFPLQDTDFEDVLGALQILHV